MGGPRASTDHQRHAGRMCTNCHRSLPKPHTPGEKFCPVCRPVHRVLMCWEWRAGRWEVVYRELNVWPFPRTNRFADPDKIREMFTRYGINREASALEHGLEVGRGMIQLELTPAQLAKLKEPTDTLM